jgi:hypothetical protein
MCICVVQLCYEISAAVIRTHNTRSAVAVANVAQPWLCVGRCVEQYLWRTANVVQM